MNEKELKITMSSLLHDIGKVIYREGGDVRRHSLSGYDYLKDEAGITDKDILDQIVDLITEICSFAKKDILINGNHIPSALVKTKFLKLDSSNIQYVMEELKKGTSKIKNPHSYLISMLYNAQNTQNVHYQSAVNSDMRNIGSKIYD